MQSSVRFIEHFNNKAEQVKLTILEVVIEGYHKCSFAICVGIVYIVVCIKIQLQWLFFSY